MGISIPLSYREIYFVKMLHHNAVYNVKNVYLMVFLQIPIRIQWFEAFCSLFNGFCYEICFPAIEMILRPSSEVI